MISYKTKTGPFAEGIFLAKGEIERICLDELRALNLLPADPQPIDIDRFIEKRFVTPVYEELGDGILGVTKFGKNGVEAIVVNSRIEEANDRTSERRIRSTLAHEGGHGLLHTQLFVLNNHQNPLFTDGKDKPTVLCRDEVDSVEQRTYHGKWWEYQANRAIGSLLLPRSLVEQALEPFLVSKGLLGFQVLDEAKRKQAEKEVSEVFNVSQMVSRIRLEEFYPAAAAGQGTL